VISPVEVRRRVPANRAYFLGESFWDNAKESFMEWISTGENYYNILVRGFIHAKKL
jgi:hypothetical protein